MNQRLNLLYLDHKQCDQIWVNFATYATFYKSLSNGWGFVQCLEKNFNLLWQNCNVFGLHFNVVHGQILKNNIAIWLHWSQSIERERSTRRIEEIEHVNRQWWGQILVGGFLSYFLICPSKKCATGTYWRGGLALKKKGVHSLKAVWPVKKSSNAYKSCPKMIPIDKLTILTPVQKLPKMWTTWAE